MTFTLETLPRTSPYATTGSCSAGSHEGTHKYVGKYGYLDEPCDQCHLPYKNSVHTKPTYDHPCSGGGAGFECMCLCHPRNQRGHWHMLNAGILSGQSRKKTICLGYQGLKIHEKLIRRMPPKAYLKRVENDDDACLERLYQPRANP